MHALSFETSPARQKLGMVYGVLLGLALLTVALIVGPFAVGGILNQVGAPAFVSVIAALCSLPLFVRLAWKITVSQLRYRITFGPDHLEIGPRFAGGSTPYDDVDLIEVAGEYQHGDWVKVRSRPIKAKVYLPPEDLGDCVSELRRHCPNAIYVDAKGQEHLPADSNHPIRNLLVLERQHAKIAALCALVAPITLFIAIARVSVLIEALKGQANLPALPLIIFGIILSSLISIGTALEAWRRLGLTRRVRDERRELTEAGVVDLETPEPSLKRGTR